MKISDELNAQAERYGRTYSFNLSVPLKHELALWYKSVCNKVLNIKCGTCIRNAMRDLIASMKNDQKPSIRKKIIPFTGVVNKALEDLSYKELKAMAKDKGIKGQYKKIELIELLKNE